MKDFWTNFTAGPGDMATATWQILIMLIGAFILGFLLRYLLGGGAAKYKAENEELKGSNKRLRDELDAMKKKAAKADALSGVQTELDSARRKNRQLEKDLVAANSATNTGGSDQTAEVEALKRTNDKLNQELEDCRKRSAADVIPAPMAAAAPVVSTEKPSSTDDLTKIEGIGKKIQEHLNNGGVWSFDQLSGTAIPRLQEILDAAGPAYTMHDPGTWPEQGAMAGKGML